MGVAVNVFAWHVHGSWMTAFVQGRHTYLIPVEPDRGPDGRGRALTWDWPPNAVEVTRDEARDLDVDVLVLQRPHELALAADWLGREPGSLPTVYVEHDVPPAPGTEHPMYHRPDVTVVHVTHFNQRAWSCGGTPTTVIEHGVVDPGARWTGERPVAVAAINEPVRRSWVAGVDLLEEVRGRVPVDLFGIDSEPLGGRDVTQAELHGEMARRRVYVHPFRWTSLGLSLIEAMALGMPVVALAATEVPRVLDPSVGAVVDDAASMADAVAALLADDERARAAGAAARELALRKFSLERFLDDWDRLFEHVTGARQDEEAPVDEQGSPRQ